MAGWARRQSPPIQGSSLSSRLVTQDLEPWASLTSESFSRLDTKGWDSAFLPTLVAGTTALNPCLDTLDPHPQPLDLAP